MKEILKFFINKLIKNLKVENRKYLLVVLGKEEETRVVA